MRPAALLLALVAFGAQAAVRPCRGGGRTDRITKGCSTGPLFKFLTNGVSLGAECTGTMPTADTGQTVSFTRSGTQTCLKTGGSLVTLTSNQPALESKGLHVESAGTNYLVNSEDFSGAWNPAGTITYDATAAPDGTTSAERIQYVTAANASVYQIGSGGGSLGSAMTSGAMSVFFKHGPGGAGPASAGIDFGAGVSTCTCTTSDGTSCSVVNSGSTFCAGYITTANVWTRLMVVATNTVGATSPVSFLRPGIAGTSATGDVYAWGAQLEPGAAFASSYIKTVGTTATRNATQTDLPNLTLSGTPSHAFTITVPGAPGTDSFFLMSGVGSADRFQTYYHATPRCAYTGSGGTVEKAHSADIPINAATRFACYYDGSNLGICNGGVCQTTATSQTIGAATTVNAIGYRRTGSDLYINGWLKSVCVDSTSGGCR